MIFSVMGIETSGINDYLQGDFSNLIIEHLEQNFEHVLIGNKVFIINQYCLCRQNLIGPVRAIF
jgi:hypothetical protein